MTAFIDMLPTITTTVIFVIAMAGLWHHLNTPEK